MTITALSTQPNSVTRPSTFNADSDTYHAELPTLITQINAATAAMTALAAGGAVSLQYTFSTTTTDADPGAGILRLDNATQNSATTIRADLLGSDTSDYSGILALLDDSTSTNKGYITLRHATTATKWLVFSVASLASPAGYKNVTVTCVASSAANPFANADAVLFDFTPTGDKGDVGSVTAASQAQMEAATDNTVIVTPLATNWHPGVAKMWLSAVGDGSGINASLNVTSVTDIGIGIIVITIGTDFSSADYVISGVAAVIAGASSARMLSVEDQAAGSVKITCNTDASAESDPLDYFIVAFGDQA